MMAAHVWLHSKKWNRGGDRPKNVSASFTGSAQTLIAAPGAGNTIVVDRIQLNNDTDDTTVSLYGTSDETGNRLVYNKLKAGGGLVVDGPFPALPANTALLGSVSSGNSFYVIWYHIEAIRTS